MPTQNSENESKNETRRMRRRRMRVRDFEYILYLQHLSILCFIFLVFRSLGPSAPPATASQRGDFEVALLPPPLACGGHGCL
jgi:hypothetical protein